jgi:mono/diheme cytochrome c family protein
MNAAKLTLALAAMMAIGPTAQTMAQEKTPSRLDDTPSFASGEDAWNKVCARCHTVEGKASDLSVGPDLSKVPYDPDTIAYFVRNGFLAMPSFPESTLDNATLADLAKYIAENVYEGE